MEKVTEPIRAYKGFDKDLKCRGFQYEIGKEYELKEGEHPVACERGFHACPNPNDLFAFYSPSEGNRFCEVELSGEIDDSESDKIAASRIKIIKELTIFEVANLKKDYTESHTDDKKSNTGNRSSASNTGNRSSASNTGDWSSASNTGNWSSASNTGDWSSASNTGDWSSAEVSGKDSVAAVFGRDCKARAAKGCALFLTERGEWNGETYPILNVLAVIVDGEKVKADTWYQLKDGELKECE